MESTEDGGKEGVSQTQNRTRAILRFLKKRLTYRGGPSRGSSVGEAADVGLGSGADHGVRDVGNLSYGAHGCWLVLLLLSCWFCLV